MDVYLNMLPLALNSSECTEDVKRMLYRNYAFLRDWGSSYAVSKGQLDQLPEDAADVVETIVSFLLEISEVLVERKSM